MRRLIRFGVEVVFLLALAGALVLAEAEPALIAGAMVAGWLVVVLFEWAGMRNRPHYGRGLPPRYYVPQVALPPPRPLEQLPAYPTPRDRDDEATWIARPEVRAAVVDEWTAPAPAAPPPPAPAVSEDTMVDELLPITLHEHRPDPWLYDPLYEVVEEADEAEEAAPVEEPVAAAPVEAPPVEEEPAVAALAIEEVVVAETVVDGAVVETVEVAETVVVATSVAAPSPALHRLDPLGDPAPRRRLRRAADPGVVVEVPARPQRPRALPGKARRERSE